MDAFDEMERSLSPFHRELNREAKQFAASLEVHFFLDVFAMCFDRFATDKKVFRNLPHAEALAQQLEDLHLPAR